MSDPGPDDPVVVWIDGRLRDPEDAGLHWSDHGITVGDGVFETIKVTGRTPFALAPHLDRLERSAAGLGLELPPRGVIEAAVDAASARWADALRERAAAVADAGAACNTEATETPEAVGRLRLTVTGGPGPAGSERGTDGPTLMVTVSGMELRRDPTPVLVVPFTRNESGALAGLKTTSYAENVVALALAREQGASEAIFANTRGELCEGTGTNVFLGMGGRLLTPPLDSGCLDGVTRRLLIKALAGVPQGDAAGVEVLEQALPISSLAAADEAFLSSTGREVQPISHVDGLAMPTAPGPLTLAAQAAWDNHYSP